MADRPSGAGGPRAAALRLRDLLIGPVVVRLENIDRRLRDLELAVQAVEARSSAVAERSVTTMETTARLDQRIRDIEKLLDTASDG